MITRDELKKLSEEELKELAQMVKEELERRKEGNKKEFEFHFEVTSHVPKWVPYVARLVAKNGKVERQFMKLDRINGKKEITVCGKYTASIGDIIEKREGGSWKNEYRYWYIVTQDGQEVKVASIGSSKEKQRVISYLKGEISANELLRDAWASEIK